MTERFVWVNDKYCVNLDAIAYFQAKVNDGVSVVVRGTSEAASVIELSPSEGDDLLNALQVHGVIKYFSKSIQPTLDLNDTQRKVDRIAETPTPEEIRQLVAWIEGGRQGPPPFDVSEFLEGKS